MSGGKWAMMLAGAVVLLGVAGGFVAGCSAPQARAQTPEVVRAERFELVDSSGTLRAVLGQDADGATRLRFLDADGTVRLVLALDSEGGGLLMSDKAGRICASLTSDMPALSLSGPGKSAAALLMMGEGRTVPTILFRDTEGRLTWTAP